MRHSTWLAVLVFGAAACSESGSERARAAADKGGKGTVVELDGLRSTAPADWKEEEVTDRTGLRVGQFRLPKKGDDKDDAAVIIFKNAGGTVKQNVDRWKGMFIAPEGKTIDDVSKLEDIKIAGRDAAYFEVHGTYLMKKRPFDPNDKGEKRPDYRMVMIQFKGPENLYHIRFVGPAKTVEAYKKGFDEWIKGFKRE
jgi:hypothetical protein